MNEEFKKSIKELIWLLIRQFFAWLRAKLDKDFEYISEYYKTTARDSIDERDFKFGIDYESREKINLPEKIDLYDWEQLNQGSTLHCVAYAGTQSVNENKFFLKDEKRVDVADVVTEIRKMDKNFDTQWTYIANAPKAMKNIWKCEKYENVMSGVEWVKKALFMWLTVMTGTNRIDWRETNKTDVAVEWNWWGHAIEINGFDDNLTLTDSKGNKYTWFFKIKNSWWENWWNNGHFFLPYEKFYLLYVWKYIMYTNESKTQEILDEKNLFDENQRDIMEKMKNKGIWNWQRPNEPVTRAEVIFMLNKIYDLISEKIWK